MPNLLLTMWDTIKSSSIGILVAAGLGMFAIIGGLSMLSYHYTPVSYTHLDVYKRQRCELRQAGVLRRTHHGRLADLGDAGCLPVRLPCHKVALCRCV